MLLCSWTPTQMGRWSYVPRVLWGCWDFLRGGQGILYEISNMNHVAFALCFVLTSRNHFVVEFAEYLVRVLWGIATVVALHNNKTDADGDFWIVWLLEIPGCRKVRISFPANVQSSWFPFAQQFQVFKQTCRGWISLQMCCVALGKAVYYLTNISRCFDTSTNDGQRSRMMLNSLNEHNILLRMLCMLCACSEFVQLLSLPQCARYE